MIILDKTAEAEHVNAFKDEIVRREDRGPSTAQLLAQSGERCFCGGKCQTVIVVCLDCGEKNHVKPTSAGAYEAGHAGHAVTISHTTPRSYMGAIVHT
jgi:hypothetical protein